MSTMDPALLCKVFFSLGTAVAIGGAFIPSVREKVMNYGSRTTHVHQKRALTDTKPPLLSLLEFIASFKVPHTWFIHYYLVSVASSIFWAVQILTHGRAFQFLTSHSQTGNISMTVNQVVLAWSFMTLQGMRRLYECITFAKASQSKMWVGVWALGIAYYLVMGISVWIEGIAALNESESLLGLLDISKPSMKTLVAVPIFLIGTGIQHDCHEYLASLKKYTIPQHNMFKSVVCPHYTSECLIYVAITILAAPNGQILNKTMLAGLAFVVSNLAVTADSTRKWYVESFGAEKLQGRWRMVPYVF